MIALLRYKVLVRVRRLMLWTAEALNRAPR